jgi:hypothetical protein
MTTDAVLVYVIELACLQCGRTIGVVESLEWPCAGVMQFRTAAQSDPMIVADWRRLRCTTCGGNAYADHVGTRRVYVAVTLDDLELPRRGRPPKWLVEQRSARRTGDDSGPDSQPD